MSYSKERDEFIAIATQEGLTLDTARKLLRHATTLHRLAEAQCNGDWPYNGDRDRPMVNEWQGRPIVREKWDRRYVVCPECEASGVSKSAMRKGVCPDCRTSQLVKTALPTGYEAIINGDPRGAVLKIKTPSGRTNNWGREGICVPIR